MGLLLSAFECLSLQHIRGEAQSVESHQAGNLSTLTIFLLEEDYACTGVHVLHDPAKSGPPAKDGRIQSAYKEERRTYLAAHHSAKSTLPAKDDRSAAS